MNTHQTFLELSTELLQIGQSIRFRARGMSMIPTILHGDFLTVVPVDPSQIRKGDIILYRMGAGAIAHRVSAIHGMASFVLRGDAMEVCDDPVKSDQVLGKVILLERDGRSIDLNRPWIKTVLAVRRICFCLRKRVLGVLGRVPWSTGFGREDVGSGSLPRSEEY